MYSEKVIELFNNPRNMGSLDKDDPNVGTGVVGSPACGDVMQLQILVDEKGIVRDVKFKTFGCAAAIAASSLATEWLIGKTVEEAKQLKNTALAEELDLPPVKMHCSVLAESAVRAAIADWEKKHGRGGNDAGPAGGQPPASASQAGEQPAPDEPAAKEAQAPAAESEN